MTQLTILIASILSGVLYRLGGWNKGNRLYRILGVPTITCITLLTLYNSVNIAWQKALLPYLLTLGLTAGMISAYWGQDEKKWGFWCHGLGISLAVLPIIFITQHWLGFSIRCLVLTAFITVWSELTKWDILEEGGRGFAIVATLPLLLLPI
jgi:hypothetical protein